MKKNTRTGSVVVYAETVVKKDGQVSFANPNGVSISVRPFGRQIYVDRFYPWSQVVSATDEGVGFAFVKERTPVASYHGSVSVTDNGFEVELESGRVITFPFVDGVQTEVHYDDDNGKTTSLEAKMGANNSKKFATIEARASKKGSPKKSRRGKVSKGKPSSKKVAKKTKKTKKVRGTRRR